MIIELRFLCIAPLMDITRKFIHLQKQQNHFIEVFIDFQLKFSNCFASLLSLL